MSVTKQQWDEIKTELSSPYGSIYLRCDGYLVAAIVTTSKIRLVIAVYVDGMIEGKNNWFGLESELGKMNEISRRFWFIRRIRRSSKELKMLERIYGKRECKKRGYYEAKCYTVPYFNTSGTLIAHLKKHNESIEILDYEAYKAARDEKQQAEVA